MAFRLESIMKKKTPKESVDDAIDKMNNPLMCDIPLDEYLRQKYGNQVMNEIAALVDGSPSSRKWEIKDFLKHAEKKLGLTMKRDHDERKAIMARLSEIERR